MKFFKGSSAAAKSSAPLFCERDNVLPKGGEEMKRLIILAVVVAVVIVLAAKYFGLFHGPAILGGQVVSLVLRKG
jgi:hypothetical protein